MRLNEESREGIVALFVLFCLCLRSFGHTCDSDVVLVALIVYVSLLELSEECLHEEGDEGDATPADGAEE